MHPRNTSVLLLLLIFNLWQPAYLSGQDNETEEGSGYFEAFLSNMLALEQGDVLIRKSVSFDTMENNDLSIEKGVAINQLELMRFLFDHKKKIYIFVRGKERWGFVGDDKALRLKSLIERKGQDVEAMMVLNGKTFARILPREKDTVQNEDLASMLRAFSVPEVRLVGMVPFGSHAMFEDRVSAIRKISRSSVSEVTELGKRKKIVISKNPRPQLTMKATYVFDTESFMPVKRYSTGIFKGKVGKPFGIETMEWNSDAHIAVPVKLSIDSPKKVELEGKVQKTTQYTDLEFKWFSVNKELPKKFLDEGFLDSEKDLLESISSRPFETEKQD